MMGILLKTYSRRKGAHGFDLYRDYRLPGF